MKEYRVRNTGELVTEQQLRASSEIIYPEALSLELLDSLGLDPVLHGPTPAAKEFETIERDGVVQDPSGYWLQAWKLAPWPQERIDAHMAQARRSKELEINAWRAEANLTSFPFRGKLVACDNLSRSDIDGVANHINLLDSFPPDFPGGWLATDNTYIPLPTIEDFKSMYSAMSKQGTANFAKSQALKAQARAATTLAEIAAITWQGEEE